MGRHLVDGPAGALPRPLGLTGPGGGGNPRKQAG